jgi:hypothetical protein
LVRQGDLSDRTYSLLVARNAATGEVKYFISNAPADTPYLFTVNLSFPSVFCQRAASTRSRPSPQFGRF